MFPKALGAFTALIGVLLVAAGLGVAGAATLAYLDSTSRGGHFGGLAFIAAIEAADDDPPNRCAQRRARARVHHRGARQHRPATCDGGLSRWVVGLQLARRFCVARRGATRPERATLEVGNALRRGRPNGRSLPWCL